MTHYFNVQRFERQGAWISILLLVEQGRRRLAARRQGRKPRIACTPKSVSYSRLGQNICQLLQDDRTMARYDLQKVMGQPNCYDEMMAYHDRVSKNPTKYDRREGTEKIDAIDDSLVTMRKTLATLLGTPLLGITPDITRKTTLLSDKSKSLEEQRRNIFKEIGEEVQFLVRQFHPNHQWISRVGGVHFWRRSTRWQIATSKRPRGWLASWQQAVKSQKACAPPRNLFCTRRSNTQRSWTCRSNCAFVFCFFATNTDNALLAERFCFGLFAVNKPFTARQISSLHLLGTNQRKLRIRRKTKLRGRRSH